MFDSPQVETDKTTHQDVTSLDWADMNGTDHFVQFYDSDEEITAAVSEYFTYGLRFGETCVMVATPEHAAAVRASLPSDGLDHVRFVSLDCRDSLERFVVDGRPDPTLFGETIGQVVKEAVEKKKPVRIFGEMVAMLSGADNAAAAVELEHLWNSLAREVPFRLFCAYPAKVAMDPSFRAICASHSQVLN